MFTRASSRDASRTYQPGPSAAAAAAVATPRWPGISLGNVLRLLDARTGSYAEVMPARRGLLRVCAQVLEAAGGSDLAGLRVLLAADLLARTAELGDLQVLTALACQDSAQSAALERAADALNIHPPAARAGPGEARQALGGPIDVQLVGDNAGSGGDQSGLVVRVGPVRPREAGPLDESAADRPDPLAIRLAMLSFPHHLPADLTEGVLAKARQTLAHWRRRVAEWAQSPSRPMPAPVADRLRAAFDDLDTVTALALLQSLEPDDDVPAGARFETFVYADRILGLDLPRDIGRTGG